MNRDLYTESSVEAIRFITKTLPYQNKDPKQNLWQAAYLGENEKFQSLYAKEILKDVNELFEGLSLFHVLVLGDRTYDVGPDKEHKLIARFLLENGANVHCKAELNSEGQSPNLDCVNGWPTTIAVGETPYDLLRPYRDNYYYFTRDVFAGTRASRVYTGEHVGPEVDKYLGEKMPIIRQLKSLCVIS